MGSAVCAFSEGAAIGSFTMRKEIINNTVMMSGLKQEATTGY